LADLMGLEICQTQYLLTSLKKEGYFELRLVKNGSNEQRLLYLSDRFKKSLGDAFPVHPPMRDDCTPPCAGAAPIIDRISIIKENTNMSAEADECVKIFFEDIKKAKPDFTKKPTEHWKKQVIELLKVRTKERILVALRWALQDSFWKANVQSPNGLLNNLDKIEAKMAGNPSKEDRKTLIAKHWKEAREHDNFGKSPSGLQIVALGQKVEFVNGPKNWEVPYDLSEEEWKEKTKF
jgi:hypothetical protein